MQTTTTVIITKMFKNCPKPDGWFGCFAVDKSNHHNIKLTGRASIPVRENMKLKITADETGLDEYKMQTYEIITDTVSSMRAYLNACPCLDSFTVDVIMSLYGVDAMNILANAPDKFKAETHMSTKKFDEFEGYTKLITAQTRIKNLAPGLTSAMIKKVILYFDNPVATITKKPYDLLEINIPWTTVDNIALTVGNVQMNSQYRLNHGIVYTLNKYMSETGDICLDVNNTNDWNTYIEMLTAVLRIRYNPVDIKNYIGTVAGSPKIPVSLVCVNNKTWFYPDKYLAAEELTASTLNHNWTETNKSIQNRITDAIDDFMIKENINLSAEQQNAVCKSLLNKYSIITGGPGTGKTTITKCICYVYEHLFGKKITLAAPTGRAAKKLTDNTNRPAETIAHIMVTKEAFIKKYAYQFGKGSLKIPSKHEDCCGLLILDESSMIDILEAAAILAICSQKGCDLQIIFIGDIDQLPPIEPGAFFHDIVTSGKIPTSFLSQCYRNSGCIESNSKKIKIGDTNLQYDLVSTMIYPQVADDQTAFDYIIDTYNQMRQTCDPKQIALLSPMQNGLIGIRELNINIHDNTVKETQATSPKLINHPVFKMDYTSMRGYPIPGTYYGTKEHHTYLRIGSRVMHTKNANDIKRYVYKSHANYFLDKYEHEEYGVFNGDTGIIIAYYPGDITKDKPPIIAVELDNGDIVHYDCSTDDHKALILAYAMTIHKAQGSEYEQLIVVMPHRLAYTPLSFTTRNLFYTAYTRAKDNVTIIGSKEMMERCIQTPMPDKKSNLIYRLV